MAATPGDQALELHGIETRGPHLAIGWSIAGHPATTSYWYEDVDFAGLRERFGYETIERLLFHVALFELTKGVSFRPERMELGRWSRYFTPALEAVWRRVVHGVWAQWRWEHDDPDYSGPVVDAAGVTADPVASGVTTAPLLAFSGGGKDSAVASHLLESAGVPYRTFGYSSSTYGTSDLQHALLEGLIARTASEGTHRAWILDDLAPLAPHSTLTSTDVVECETPASIFGVLPLLLATGLRTIVLGHERSANVGNLIWARTGEVVNHQWGKSYEAETLLNAYVREHLLTEFSYFSLLQPLHDSLIFAILRTRPDLVPATHSCNVRKPWCMRCAKCAYIWISYQAWLDVDIVDHLFGGANLLDSPENALSFRQMLGLEEHTPFECIGQVPEARLAFALAHARGLRGAAMKMFEDEIGLNHPWSELAAPYLRPYADKQNVPKAIFSRLWPYLLDQGDAARAYVARLLRS